MIQLQVISGLILTALHWHFTPQGFCGWFHEVFTSFSFVPRRDSIAEDEAVFTLQECIVAESGTTRL
jgi:hypothetical protein